MVCKYSQYIRDADGIRDGTVGNSLKKQVYDELWKCRNHNWLLLFFMLLNSVSSNYGPPLKTAYCNGGTKLFFIKKKLEVAIIAESQSHNLLLPKHVASIMIMWLLLLGPMFPPFFCCLFLRLLIKRSRDPILYKIIIFY